MNDAVSALTVFDDGRGPALYAGGIFTTAGDRASSFIAAWRCAIPERKTARVPPKTPGAFQTTYGGGDQDAFIVKIGDD